MNIPFETIDWSVIPEAQHAGLTGNSISRTIQYPGLRIRLVQYTPGYMADHWCQKGHIVFCLEGEFVSELSDGRQFVLTSGSTYVVSDDLSSHRSHTTTGVKLLIIDGDFLQPG